MITYEKYEQIRNSKGLKNSDVARIAQIPPSTFTDWKQGKSMPKYEKMSKIAAALDMDYNEFVGPYGKFSALNPNRPDIFEGDPEARARAELDSELLRLYHNATPDAQTSVMTLLRNSQREKSSDSLKEA